MEHRQEPILNLQLDQLIAIQLYYEQRDQNYELTI